MGDHSQVVLGTYPSHAAAKNAAAALVVDGYKASTIDILVAGSEGNLGDGHTVGPKSIFPNSGAYKGALIGGVVGMLGGMALVAITGADPTFAAGNTLTTVLGAGFVGALGCGISMAFVGLGVPEHEEKRYEEVVQHGGVLLSVQTETTDQVTETKGHLQRLGAKDIASAEQVGSEWTKVRPSSTFDHTRFQ
jgi:hypothetical protein